MLTRLVIATRMTDDDFDMSVDTTRTTPTKEQTVIPTTADLCRLTMSGNHKKGTVAQISTSATWKTVRMRFYQLQAVYKEIRRGDRDSFRLRSAIRQNAAAPLALTIEFSSLNYTGFCGLEQQRNILRK